MSANATSAKSLCNDRISLTLFTSIGQVKWTVDGAPASGAGSEWIQSASFILLNKKLIGGK